MKADIFQKNDKEEGIINEYHTSLYRKINYIVW